MAKNYLILIAGMLVVLACAGLAVALMTPDDRPGVATFVGRHFRSNVSKFLAVRKTARIAPLQLAKNRLGLQPRVAVEQLADLVPNRLERTGPRRPGVRLGDVAGQLAQIAVLACRLLIH